MELRAARRLGQSWPVDPDRSGSSACLHEEASRVGGRRLEAVVSIELGGPFVDRVDDYDATPTDRHRLENLVESEHQKFTATSRALENLGDGEASKKVCGDEIWPTVPDAGRDIQSAHDMWNQSEKAIDVPIVSDRKVDTCGAGSIG